MTDTMIDLRALLIEREEFEGSMVSKLREGLSQGGTQIRTLKEINETLAKASTSRHRHDAKKIASQTRRHPFFLGPSRQSH